MLRHIFKFYFSFAPAAILVTLACVFIYRQWGSSTLSALMCFKLLTDLFIYFIAGTLGEKKAYYYYNLHLSKAKLWSLSFGFDLLLLVLLFSVTKPLNIPS